MPKVSIIVPVYNVESKLRRCLDSIKHQDYSDFECILVDDGSSDISGNICDEYAHSDRRFKVLHQKNHGVSAARNAGLKVALGDWILFVDSDDWVSSQFISAFFNGSMADIVFQGLMKDSLQGSNPVLFEHNPTHVFVENLYYLEKKIYWDGAGIKCLGRVLSKKIIFAILKIYLFVKMQFLLFKFCVMPIPLHGVMWLIIIMWKQ